MNTGSKLLISLALVLALLEYKIIPKPAFSFICNDPKLSHPFTGDTVSPKHLLGGVFLGSLIIIALIEYLGQERSQTAIWWLYKRCAFGCVAVMLCVEVIKSVVSEPRPHFLDSCRPNSNQHCNEGDVIFEFNCTNTLGGFTRSDLTRSFPSGHTSLSIFVALYCSSLVVMRIPSDAKRTFIIKVFLITFCVGWSLLCSVSRILDKRHHWWDVAVGAVIGAFSAYYVITYSVIWSLRRKVDTGSVEHLVAKSEGFS